MFSQIIVDSGAIDHIFATKSLLSETNNKKHYPHVTAANGLTVPIDGSGITRFFSKEIEAAIVPELKTNPLSISKCINIWNCNVIFTPQKIIFQDRALRMMIGEKKQVNGLYVLNLESAALVSINSRVESSQLWHKRLGHPSNRILHHLNLSSVHDLNNYDPCHFAKLHRLSFPEYANRPNELFDLIHSDVWGPAPVDSKKDFKYFVSFIDDKSRTTWLYLLKSKSEVFSIFKPFVAWLKISLIQLLKLLDLTMAQNISIWSFKNLQKMGIIHQTSCVGTSQQNRVAERKNRHLLV
jgi:GAG-pre-integrase domain